MMRTRNSFASLSYRCVIVTLIAMIAAGCETKRQDPVNVPPRVQNGILDHDNDPAWLKDIEAPSIHNESEASELWQSKPRCCSGRQFELDARVFYKSCSDAIDRHGDDEDLVVVCLWLMPLAVKEREQAFLYETLIEKYFSHNDSLRRCVHCEPGDTITRAAQDLASLYSGDRADDAIALLERVLDQRGDTTSAWVKIEVTTQLGWLYSRRGLSDGRTQRMNAAYETFYSMRNEETIFKRWKDFQKMRAALEKTAESHVRQP